MGFKKISLLVSFILFVLVMKAHSEGYFQQGVVYKITVKLDDIKDELNAFEIIEYTNHSPQELSFIYFHLWPNAYKDNTTAMAKQLEEDGDLKFHYATKEQRGYIDGLDFTVDGKRVKLEYDSVNKDICKLILAQPLRPGGKILITTPFHVKIPDGIFSRLGHSGQSYQVSQWYPKPAVYDRNGWHPLPYLNQGEFYSEFARYEVTITLPRNYVVGATGDLTGNEEEQKFMAEKVKETEEMIARDSMRGNPNPEHDMSFPPSDTITKTLRFEQEKVHDFAWFADKRYHVLKGETELPLSKRKVTTWTLFTDNEKEIWENSLEYVNNAIYYYSLWVGEYPYNQATAVEGSLTAGGGMEYPNITIIGPTKSSYILENTIVHEVGHNWFYGILGSNERDHAWMDEGINSYYENRYMNMKYPKGSVKSELKVVGLGGIGKLLGIDNMSNSGLLAVAYYMKARKNLDQPIDMPAAYYTQINYGGVVYEKTAIEFRYLEEYLGLETFDRCMKKYFESWKFDHPLPDDLRTIFTTETGKDYGWFFDNILKTNDHIDYKIVSARPASCPESTQGFCTDVKIQNKGHFISPFCLSAFKHDSLISTQWFEGFNGTKKVTADFPDYDLIKVDGKEIMPDIDRRNNSLKAKGILKTTEKLQLKFLGGLENPDRTQLYYLPLVGWNEYDNMMAGMAFYNSLIPSKRFEFVAAPMYGFGSQKLDGFGSAFYNWYPLRNFYNVFSPGNYFQNIQLGINTRKFSDYNSPLSLDYTKIAPELNMTVLKKEARSPVSQHIRIRMVNIIQQRAQFSYSDNSYFKFNDTYFVNEISYKMKNKRKLNPYSASLVLQQGNGFLKSWVEGNYRFSFHKARGVDIRFFSGKFLLNDHFNDFGFQMSGNSDYLRDQLFLARTATKGKLSHQFAVSEGGFKNSYTTDAAEDWMVAMNIESSIIAKLPFRLYADGGVSDRSTTFEYDAGIAFTPIPGVFQVYFPLAMAKELHTSNYGDKIRFVLNFNLLNPFELIRNATE